MTQAICAMPSRAHPRLVVEDAAEVVAVGKHLGLVRQVGPAAVDQIDARQAVLQRDLLRAQVLLHRQREIGAALHRGVVGDDHHLAARHPADAGDQAGARRLAVIEAVGGQLAHLQEGRAESSSRSTRSRGSELAARPCRSREASGPPSAACATRRHAASRPGRG